MIDLIADTLEYMDALGYTKDDVQWIGGKHFVVPSELFWNAKDQIYDNGYGAAEVPLDLVIVFKDGSWIERYEYDGSEWWTYKKVPTMPLEIRPMTNFISKNYAYSLLKLAEEEV